MIYLDIETLDFFQDEHIKSLPRVQQIAAIRFGCAVTAQIDDGAVNDHAVAWCDWEPHEVVSLYDYLVESKELLVGWNIAAFDWPIICANVERAGWRVLELETEPAQASMIDIFAMIRQTTGRWYKLEDIAQANLGRGKLADGQSAAEWLRSGDHELESKAFEYCRHDVQLVIELHSILLRGDALRLPPRAQRQELNELLWRLDGHERIPDATGAVSTR